MQKQETSLADAQRQIAEDRKRLLEEQNKNLTDEQRRERDEKLEELKLGSRFLPDSSLTTYFGKPAFYNYGNKNLEPTSGGYIYGDYLKTHNINPHSGQNRPEFSQIHGNALLGGTSRSKDKTGGNRFAAKKKPQKMVRNPVPPRIAAPKVTAEQIVAQHNKDPQTLHNVERCLKESEKIQPETFKATKARPIQINPVKWEEKHLHTKSVKEDDDLRVAQMTTGNSKLTTEQSR